MAYTAEVLQESPFRQYLRSETFYYQGGYNLGRVRIKDATAAFGLSDIAIRQELNRLHTIGFLSTLRIDPYTGVAIYRVAD